MELAAVQDEPAAISKHLRVLERAGLISRGRDGQRRPCRIEAKPARRSRRLVGELSPYLEANFQHLDSLLEELKAESETPKST